MILYRGYEIQRDPHNPGISYAHIWHWTHESYDGPGDPRHGIATSLREAMDEIDEREEEKCPSAT